MLTSGGHLSPLGFAACQSVHQPSNIDMLLTTLVHLRQVHPLKDTLTSVRSVDSVGEYTQPNHLCRSVKSVGGSSQQVEYV